MAGSYLCDDRTEGRSVVSAPDGAKCDSKILARLARRRGSVFGRNLKGVWYTDGALAGGLKMMWSCCRCESEARNDG